MTNPKELITKIDPKALKPLFVTKPFLHVLAMMFDWIIIFLTIIICIQYPNPILYFLSVLIIGARMHGLAILNHDATHFRFLKNRKWNDLLTNYFIMYPIFTSIEKYRANHLRHHQNLNTEDDPDWIAKLTKREFEFPKTKKEFLRTVGSYLLLYQGALDAYWFLKRFNTVSDKKKMGWQEKFAIRSFYILLFAGLTIFGLWKYYLLFWVVPYFSTFFMFQYIRSVAEHFGELAYDDILTSSRTVLPNLLETFFISPHNVGYHLEHHLYPGVPFYHLPQLHKLLMEQDAYKNKAHITVGYTSGLMNELGRAYPL